MSSTTLTSKGQVVIPKTIRQKLGLAKGAKLKVGIEANRIVLTAAARLPPELRLQAPNELVERVLAESDRADDQKLRRLLRDLGVTA
jgi:AbrB family looped-hinge helix DNA binding protein